MEIICPHCKKQVAAEGVNISAKYAYCTACQAGFDIDDVVEEILETETPPVERPPDARSNLIREEDKLVLALPRGGLSGPGCFMTFFAVFWNSITWFFVAMIVLSMFGAVPAGTVKSNGSPIFVLLFLIPFMVIGIVTGTVALYTLFGETSVAMDREQLLFRRSLFGRNWDRTYPTANITSVRITEAYKQNKQPVYGVGIQLKEKSMALTFGSTLSDAEKNWLVHELNVFLRELRKKAT